MTPACVLPAAHTDGRAVRHVGEQIEGAIIKAAVEDDKQ
jgi:hypothetical protein